MTRLLLLCCLLSLCACGGDASPPTATPSAPSAPAAAAVLLAGKVKIKAADDSVLWSLKPAEGGAKLLEADERELARYRINELGKIVVKDVDDQRLGAVEGEAGKWRIVDPSDHKQFVLQRQEDGDWKLEDAEERLLVRIQKQDYGWKLEWPNQQVLGKVKLKDGKLSLRDADEQTRWQTKDAFATLGFAVMACEDVPIELRAALALRAAGEP
jgi:hypothetical protein